MGVAEVIKVVEVIYLKKVDLDNVGVIEVSA